jgi:hypothetical protein
MLQPVVAAHWEGVVVSAVGHDGAVQPYQVQVGPVTQVANVDPHERPLAGMQLFSWYEQPGVLLHTEPESPWQASTQPPAGYIAVPHTQPFDGVPWHTAFDA